MSVLSPLRGYLGRAREMMFTGGIGRLAAHLHQRRPGGADPAGAPPEVSPARQLAAPAAAPATTRPLPWADPEPPEGAAEPQSAFYVERPADTAAVKAIQGQGVTITIKGARQVGKTSLLARIAAEAREQGKHVLALDFQLFERRVLGDANLLFKYLCEIAGNRIGVESRVEAFWGNLGNSYNCTRYFERYLLEQLDAPLVLAIDKLDRIRDTALRSDFFGMLRAWCQNRATTPVWKRLDLVLATSMEPHQLIDNPYQSPFNTGLTLALDDFTPEQVAELNQRHGQPFTPAQVQALTALLSGHPYLTRRALYLAADRRHTPDEIIARAQDDGGPFGDHLRYHLFRLYSQPHLVAELGHIINRGVYANEQAFYELHSAGFVCREGERVVPRCQLYAAFFKTHL